MFLADASSGAIRDGNRPFIMKGPTFNLNGDEVKVRETPIFGSKKLDRYLRKIQQILDIQEEKTHEHARWRHRDQR